MMNKFSKFIFVFVVFGACFLFAKSASAATYYISVADGNDTNCTGLAQTAYVSGSAQPCPWKTISKVNASSFSAGDSILFKRGETWNESIFVPSSGSSGNPIVFGAYGTGNKPILTDSTNAYNVSIFQKNYITIQDLDLRQTASTAARNVWPRDNTGLTLQRLDLSSTGFNIDATTDQTSLDINNITSTGVATSRQIVYIHGTTNTNISINTVTGSGGTNGVRVDNCSNLNLSNINVTNSGYDLYTNLCSNITLSNINTGRATTAGVYIGSGSGSLTAANITDIGSATGIYIDNSNFSSATFTTSTLTNNTTQGIYFASSANITFNTGTISGSGSDGGQLTGTTHNIAFNDFIFSNNGGNGFGANNDAYNITFTRDTFNNNHANGFGVYGNAHDITFNSSVMHNNGDKTILADGCAVAAHTTSYNINIRNSLSYNNIEGGFCAITTSSGTIENSVAYNNGGAWGSEGGSNSARGGVYISTTGPNATSGVNWAVKNLISALNYPREVRLDSPANEQVTINYNVYYPTDSNIFASLDAGNTNIPWSAYSSREPNSVNSNPLFINAPTNFQLQHLSPAIDAGTNVGLTADYLGNHIYGTPDIGPYEYQPPYTISTDLVDPSGSIRIYSDGKYRYTTATSSTQSAIFSVSPVGGWPSSDYSEYMNVTLDSWSTSGAKNKQWTATSSIATNTIYTIGNLAPSKYYQFKLDGAASTTAITGDTCTSGLCLSDSSGNLTFTYTGGYSTHTFALEQDTGAPLNVGISSISADSTTQLTITSQTATDADPGLHSAPYWFNETTGHFGGSSSTDWQTSTSFVDSGLSSNTQYTYQVKARDNNLNESAYSDSLSKYTLAPIPTNLSASLNSNNITLTVDSFSNDTSGQSGYYFSRSGGGNSGWIQTNSWTDTELSCGHEYTYSIKYRNGDGTDTSEISTTKSTSGCGGGGSPAMWTLPTVPSGGFKLNINSGALTTSNRNVFLGFNAGADIKKMAISMTGDFTDASQENYVASKQWDLCSKLGGAIKSPTCPDGTYKIYAQFYTAYGRTIASAIASSTIVLKSGSTNSNIDIGQIPTTQTSSNIGQLTLVLKYGSNNTQVLWLQNLLNNLGFFPANVKPNGNFGPITKQAVQKFQCANNLVCRGNERTTGYGQVGPKTRQVLNSQNH